MLCMPSVHSLVHLALLSWSSWMPEIASCGHICSVMDETSSSLFVANLNKALGPAYVGNGLPQVCKMSQPCEVP